MEFAERNRDREKEDDTASPINEYKLIFFHRTQVNI